MYRTTVDAHGFSGISSRINDRFTLFNLLALARPTVPVLWELAPSRRHRSQPTTLINTTKAVDSRGRIERNTAGLGLDVSV